MRTMPDADVLTGGAFPDGATQPAVGVVMGSWSDWTTMSAACDALTDSNVPWESRVVSAHRTPDLLIEYAENAANRGIRVIVAGAGGAAHLPGMLAAKTTLPVLGVPVKSSSLNGLDSLLSIVQMPRGIPVGTLAIGTAGAHNAGLLAAQIIALNNPDVAKALAAARDQQRDRVLNNPNPSSTPNDNA